MLSPLVTSWAGLSRALSAPSSQPCAGVILPEHCFLFEAVYLNKRSDGGAAGARG